MNMNRLRPTGVKGEDLGLWLASVVHDAARDANEAGMPERECHSLLQTMAEMHRPAGVPSALDAVFARLIVRSWREILFLYDGLTDLEQEIISREEHTRVVEWLLHRKMIYKQDGYEGYTVTGETA